MQFSHQKEPRLSPTTTPGSEHLVSQAPAIYTPKKTREGVGGESEQITETKMRKSALVEAEPWPLERGGLQTRTDRSWPGQKPGGRWAVYVGLSPGRGCL